MEEWNLQAVVGLAIMVVALCAIVAYPRLQLDAIRRLEGVWRAFGLLPLVVMAAVLVVTIPAFLQGANLWPLYLIFITPFAYGYLWVLLYMHRQLAARRDGL